MQKWIAGIAIMLCVTVRVGAQETYADKVEKYVKEYKNLAIAEQERCGIPAAVTLGQGILETDAGCSELATEANNHFGIKCKRDWKGETFAHTDDAPNECFRKYDCAASSYKDHSDYLSHTPRYASLFKLSPTDYSGWATGLKRCGYATSPTYAQRLINIIQQFNLQDYTYIALNDATNHDDQNMYASAVDSPSYDKIKMAADEAKATIVAKPNYTTQTTAVKKPNKDFDGIVTVNGLKAIYAHKGDALLPYAMKYNIRYEKILEINDLPDAPLKRDMYVFLEKKAVKGWHAIHIVAPGETIHSISQEEGVQLKKLMAYNHLKDGDEPIAGSILNLQDYADKTPMVTYNPDATHAAGATDETTTTNTVATKQTDDYVATKPVADVVSNDTIDATNDTVDENTVSATAATTNEPATATDKIASTPVAKQDAAPATTPAEDNTTIATSATTADDNATVATPTTTPVTPAETIPASVPATVVKNANDEPANNTVAASDESAEPKEAPKTDKPGQQDDLAKLKSQLDKIVYGDKSIPAATNSAPSTAITSTPNEAAAPQQEKQVITASTADDVKYYTVKKGDTAFGIAKRNNITVHQLMLMNNLDFDGIKVGQRLRIK